MASNTTFDKSDARSWFGSRHSALEKEQARHIPLWREIKEYILPKYGIFDKPKENDTDLPEYGAILNSTATKSVQVFVAFIMAGVSSPARPWFRLMDDESGRNLSGESRAWLDYYRDLMLEIFARSNFYRSLPLVYTEGIGFGNGCMYCATDDEDVVRFYHYPIGTYYWGLSSRLEVDTIYRPFQLTVKQLVQQFGLDNCSKSVQLRYKDPSGRQLQQMIDVVHAIEPNTESIPEKARPTDKSKKFISVYYESSRKADTNKFLSISGFREFPAMALRIDAMGHDAYGVGAGADVLGDVKELQHHEIAKATALDYMNEPHLKSDGNVGEMHRHPGAVTQVSPDGGDDALKPVFQVNYPIEDTLRAIEVIELRVKETLDNHLARNVIDNTRSNTTAREIDAAEQEKLLLAGPRLESIQNFLSWNINRLFEIMITEGIGDPPPEELMGADLGVEYLGLLSQAQKAVGTRAIEKVWSFAATISEMKGGDLAIFDKLNADESLDDYGRMIGVPSDQMNDEDVVQETRQQRAQAEQQAQQMAQAEQAAGIGKTIGETNVSEGSPLSEAMDVVGGGL